MKKKKIGTRPSPVKRNKRMNKVRRQWKTYLMKNVKRECGPA
jgi:hypothetical protein